MVSPVPRCECPGSREQDTVSKVENAQAGADTADRMATGRGASRQLKLLELLVSAGRPMTTREMAERSDLPRPSAHRILQSLVDDGWAISEGTPARFRPSWLLVELGFQVASGNRARDAMLQAGVPLVRSVEHTAVLSFYEAGTVLCTDLITMRRDEPELRLIGSRFRARETAAGRVFLAYLPDDELPLDVDEVRSQLTAIRAKGYEMRTAHHAPAAGSGTSGLAAPVFDQSRR